MSTITLPDPFPGRCRNYRNGLRCLDYDNERHVCSFEKIKFVTQQTGAYTMKKIEPKQWVKPE